jgi:sec-independent protein translocase protein TatC
MPRIPPPDKDLFENSTMTFGQHLEELRACLFKAILGLVIGCLLGLAVGGPVVEFIQTPLLNALSNYYKSQASKKSFNEAEMKKLTEAGYTSPADLDRIRKIIGEQSVSFEVVYMDPKVWMSQLQESAPVIPADSVPANVKLSGELPEKPSGTPSDIGSTGLKPVVLFRPIADDPRTHVKSLNAQEAFMIYMKASLLVGAILASPWVFYQIWAFVAAGLYPHEKRYIHIFLPVSIILFLTGAGMAFFLVFEKVLTFLFSFNAMLGIDPDPRISEWMSFVLLLPLGFGVSFQLPLVMLFLERIGVVTVRGYLSSWRVAILGIFVLAMLLTPSGDPYSMMLMAGPLTILYFGGVLLCHFLPRGRSRFDEA